MLKPLTCLYMHILELFECNVYFLYLVLLESDESRHFAVCLMNAFWKLHSCQPVNPVLSPLYSTGKNYNKL